MTSSEPATRERKTRRRHRSPHGLGLFVTDGELIEMLGVPSDVAERTIRELDRKHRETLFPQKQAIWGDRRSRTAIEAWLEFNYGLKMQAPRLRSVS